MYPSPKTLILMLKMMNYNYIFSYYNNQFLKKVNYLFTSNIFRACLVRPHSTKANIKS